MTRCRTRLTRAVHRPALVAPPAHAQERGPLGARASASYFFVGGKIDTSVEGSPMVGHMYVEYMIPAARSASLSDRDGARRQPDRHQFHRHARRPRGLGAVFRAPRLRGLRGRPGRRAAAPPIGRRSPTGRCTPSRLNFVEQRFVAPERFKQWPQAHLHTQWPGAGKPGDPAFDQFYASQFPSIVSFPKQQEINRDALVALLDKIGPSILLTHSQSGAFNWPVADARPNLLKALVAVEPSGPPVHDIENTGAPDWFKDAERTKALRPRATCRSPMIRR